MRIPCSTCWPYPRRIPARQGAGGARSFGCDRLRGLGSLLDLRRALRTAERGVCAVAMAGDSCPIVFTPLLAAWSIWVGIGISARSNDIRVAQELGMLASLPTVAVTSLLAFNVIHATLGLALSDAAALLLLNGLDWRITSATFDRERLISGTRS